MIPNEAIILVGGLGTRLRPVVADVPKPLAPIAGKPFLVWLLDGLARQGLRRVVLATGYLGHLVQERIGHTHAGMAVAYAQEDEPLGTGGAIWAALPLCAGERVFVANGDTWVGVALAALAGHALAADLVLAVRPVPDRAQYGSVVVAGDRVTGMAEKGMTGPGLVNAGLYLMRRDLPRRRPMAGAFSLEHAILAAPEGLDLRAVPTEAPFIDIGTPADFAAAQTLLPQWAAGRAA
jgi:D-glycero-alpha-D-manno-heptose 1-phosphate guanylyltransferase